MEAPAQSPASPQAKTTKKRIRCRTSMGITDLAPERFRMAESARAQRTEFGARYVVFEFHS
jgi:hypothetical protein